MYSEHMELAANGWKVFHSSDMLYDRGSGGANDLAIVELTPGLRNLMDDGVLRLDIIPDKGMHVKWQAIQWRLAYCKQHQDAVILIHDSGSDVHLPSYPGYSSFVSQL